MGFSMSGRVAAGAQDALLQLMAERRMEEQMRRQQEMEQARMAEMLRANQLQEQRQEKRDAIDAENRTLDLEDRAERKTLAGLQRRQGDNQAGVRRMMGDFLIQTGAHPNAGERASLQGMAMQEDVDLPKIATEPSPEEQAAERERARAEGFSDFKQRADYQEDRMRSRPTAPTRDPIADYRARKEIDAEFRPQGGGRPVMAGDAHRIADVDEALNLLSSLEGTETGAGSQLGALLPNAVTEFTGIGAESKQRQGQINQVKQIIGKALEGGVLRKEDEAKYSQILPSIGDPPNVAASKLRGLRQTLEQKRQIALDALEDAGYDTSKFRARERNAPAALSPYEQYLQRMKGGE